MKLIHKLLFAPIVAVVLMLVLGGVDRLALNKVGNAVATLTNQHLTKVRQAKQIETDMLTIHAAYYRLFVSLSGAADESKVKAQAVGLAQNVEALSGLIKHFETNTDEEKQLLAEMLKTLDVYKKTAAQAIDIGSVDPNIGLAMMMNADEAFRAISASIAVIVKQQESAAQANVLQVLDLKKKAGIFSSIILLLSAVASISLAVWLGNSLAVRLGQAATRARSIAAGDLNTAMHDSGSDEVRLLADALDEMRGGLRGIVGKIGESTVSLSASATSVTQAAGSVSAGVDAQTNALQASAAAIEELTVSIGMVSGRADDLRKIVKETAGTADRGLLSVRATLEELHRISNRVESVLDSMRSLSSASDEVSHVTQIIREVADQTNLLALNAAIEAARAGEQGRGFAVVADEVRKLAEKTGNATAKIQSTIDSIQLHSASAMSDIKDSVEQVSQGVALVETLRIPLEEMDTRAAEALSGITELSDTVREQTSTCTMIAQNMEKISLMGSNNLDAAILSRDAAQRLGNLSLELQDSVQRFKC